MYTLKCSDIGGGDCHYEATAETKEEAKKMIMDHAKSAHPEKMQSMTEDQVKEMDAKMDELLAAQG